MPSIHASEVQLFEIFMKQLIHIESGLIDICHLIYIDNVITLLIGKFHANIFKKGYNSL